MDMKTIYVMDYDVLRGTKDNLYHNLYENIPFCLKHKKYVCLEVESVPKENEIILMKKDNLLVTMHVYKVVYYEWKIFVIANNTEGDLRFMTTGPKKEMLLLPHNVHKQTVHDIYDSEQMVTKAIP